MLNLIKIFEGSFGGATLYENPSYVTPNAVSNDHFHNVMSKRVSSQIVCHNHSHRESKLAWHVDGSESTRGTA